MARKKATVSKIEIEEEAKEFIKGRQEEAALGKSLTLREYYAGQVLSGLLARSRGVVSMAEFKREAYEWADYMLKG
jgi:hypothetical protein